MPWLVRLAFVSVLLIGLPLRSQAPEKQVRNLIFSCTCDDTVGKSFARAFRDEIARSPRYDEIADTKENKKKAMVVSVVSLATDSDESGQSTQTALSIVLVFDGYMLDQRVQVCGLNATKGFAAKTLDAVDSLFAKS